MLTGLYLLNDSMLSVLHEHVRGLIVVVNFNVISHKQTFKGIVFAL